MDTQAERLVSSLVGSVDEFLESILSEVAEVGFDSEDFSQLDHLCYRAANVEDYRQLRRQFEHFGRNLGEVEVGGRPISTFLLNQPIRFGRWRIDVLELTSPKVPGELPVGLEHIEFVLFRGLDEFVTKYPHKEFEKKNLWALFNPRLSYLLPSGRSVKFHLLSLAAVVYFQVSHGHTAGQ